MSESYAAMRRRLMLGVVARLARTPAREAFVLRGGLLTSLWLAPVARPTRDLDFVGDFAWDVADTRRRFEPVLAVELDDGIQIARELHAAPLWERSAFPGVRLVIQLGLGAIDQELSVDIGFNDPLVPAAIERDGVRVVRPETQLAWKLHALAEMTTSFRPKDLADLALIVEHVPLDDADLASAIVAAFASRGFTLASARDVLGAEHWTTKTSRLRWDRQTLAETLALVRARLDPILETL